MLATPADTPQTMPVVLPAVATAVLLLAHVPPVVALVRVTQLPTHIVNVPVMAAGMGLTVMVVVVKQPVAVTV